MHIVTCSIGYTTEKLAENVKKRFSVILRADVHPFNSYPGPRFRTGHISELAQSSIGK